MTNLNMKKDNLAFHKEVKIQRKKKNKNISLGKEEVDKNETEKKSTNISIFIIEAMLAFASIPFCLTLTTMLFRDSRILSNTFSKLMEILSL